MKFLDLFAGIGGFRLGMEAAGHECIGYVEWDKHARKSYEAIHDTKGEWTANDITKVTNDELQQLKGKGIDVICGGFPCQSFSIAGNRRGFEDTRGTLFFEIVRFAKELQPKYLFLENVAGLLNSKTTVSFEFIAEILNQEIIGGTLWEKEFLPTNNWNTLSDNISYYLANKLQLNLIYQNHKSDISSTRNLELIYEKSAAKVEHGLRKRMKYLVIQILQTMKNQSDYQTELEQQLNGKEKEWAMNLNKLYSIDNLKAVDISILEKMVVINGAIEKLLNKKLEGNSEKAKSFTILTESKQTIDRKICTFVQEVNILLFIIKQWRLSTNLWKKVTLNLMKMKGSTYYVETFNIIIKTLNEIGYEAEWQTINTKDYGLPHNRERVFIIGHSRGSSTGTILPIRGFSQTDNSERDRIKNDPELPTFNIKEATKKGYATALVGDTINFEFPNSKTRRGRVGKGVAQTLTTSCNQAVLTKDGRIRRLTPLECWRLQGFPDSAFDKAREVNSDVQLYKQAGNGVSVNVIYEIAKKLN